MNGLERGYDLSEVRCCWVHPGEALEMGIEIMVKFQKLLRRLTHENKLQENVPSRL